MRVLWITILAALGIWTAAQPPQTHNGQPVQMGFWNFVVQGAMMGISALMARKKKKDAGEDVSSMPMTPEEEQALQMLMQNGQMSREQAQQMFGLSTEWLNRATPLLESATGALGRAGDYYTGLMEGDTAKRAEFLAPELNEIQRNYGQAMTSASKFLPEGGEKNRVKSNLMIGKAGETARLLSTTRPFAADKMMQVAGGYGDLFSDTANVGTQLGGLGVAQTGVANQAGAGALDYFSSRRQQDLTRRGQNAQIWGDIGRGAGSILSAVLNRNK